MFIRIVKMHFRPEEVPAFLKIFEESYPKITGFEGCERLTLLQDREDANIFFTYSYWQQPEDLDNYRQSKLFGEVWRATKALFAAPAAAWSVDQVYGTKDF